MTKRRLLVGYTDVRTVFGDFNAAGTLVRNNEVQGQNHYAFRFRAPNKAGRWMLKMDRSEWWSAPYGSGQAERIFESGSDAFWYASNPEEGADGSRPVSVIEVYQVDEPVNPDEKYTAIDGINPTYFALFMEAFGSSADENFTYLENTNGVIWYEGTYYIYDRPQTPICA